MVRTGGPHDARAETGGARWPSAPCTLTLTLGLTRALVLVSACLADPGRAASCAATDDLLPADAATTCGRASSAPNPTAPPPPPLAPPLLLAPFAPCSPRSVCCAPGGGGGGARMPLSRRSNVPPVEEEVEAEAEAEVEVGGALPRGLDSSRCSSPDDEGALRLAVAEEAAAGAAARAGGEWLLAGGCDGAEGVGRILVGSERSPGGGTAAGSGAAGVEAGGG